MAIHIRVHSNPLCERVVVSWHIERHAMKKRRRNWRVVRHEVRIPCAYKLADGSVVMHPTLYAQLQHATHPPKDTP